MEAKIGKTRKFSNPYFLTNHKIIVSIKKYVNYPVTCNFFEWAHTLQRLTTKILKIDGKTTVFPISRQRTRTIYPRKSNSDESMQPPSPSWLNIKGFGWEGAAPTFNAPGTLLLWLQTSGVQLENTAFESRSCFLPWPKALPFHWERKSQLAMSTALLSSLSGVCKSTSLRQNTTTI